MPDPQSTTIQSLPLIQPSQAQKHVTHNEALKQLDVMVQLSVLNRDQVAAPVSPVLGQCHIVAVAATGLWAGQDKKIAVFTGQVWEFFAPRTGWFAYVAAEAQLAVYDGSVWRGPSEQPATFSQLGISAVADATNRLSVSSPATLLNNAGAGHQVKINKAAVANTASLLFQTGFSGRAEMGTVGVDDFGIKVSADGTTFFQGILIDRTTGRVRVMNGLGVNPAAGDPAAPVDGDVWYNATSGKFRARQSGANVDLIGSAAGAFSDTAFKLQDNLDATKQVQFEVAGVTTGTTRTLNVPDISGEMAVLPGAQTFTGAKTFSGSFVVSGASGSLGTATVAASYGIGTGATAAAASKSVNIGTAGVSGSTTTVTIGSAVAGALGTTVINSPTVTFASGVTSVAMTGANVLAAQMGVGGATADAANRLSVTGPATLLSNSGNGHQVKVNKAAAGDTASLMFQTGFSGRAEMGTTGNDDFTIKVSNDGATFFDGVVIDRTNGRVKAQNGLRLTPAAGDLGTPVDGDLWYNSTTGKFRARQAGGTVDVIVAGGSAVFSDTAFTLQDNLDATKQAQFELAGLTTATTRSYTLPDVTGELASLAGAQTFTGAKTVSGAFVVSGASASIGTATTAASYALGAGATAAALTKTVAVGTLGVSGSTTTISIGSAVAGALGSTTVNSPTIALAGTAVTLGAATGTTTVSSPTIALPGTSVTLGTATGTTTVSSPTIALAGSAVALGVATGTTTVNSPTVTFASSVTAVSMASANLSAAQVGVGGAAADATNRLSVTAPGVLFNHAGTGVEATLNKNAVGDNADIAFKQGFSTRAQLGLLGNANTLLRVSADGTTFNDAWSADAATGGVTFAKPAILTGQAGDPGSPADGWIWHNSTTGQVKVRSGGQVKIIDSPADLGWLTPVAGDYMLTTIGSGGATGTLIGAAGRIDAYPFTARAETPVTGLAVNVTTAVAAALGKIAVYDSDAAGRPNALITETADLDFSTVGVKTATVAITLRQGRTYWLAVRHSSTATLSTWAATATPDINGGAPVTTQRKIVRRTLAYATAATATWGWLASEINAAGTTSVWLKV